MSNPNGNGIVISDLDFAWGIGTNQPISGDWDGNGITTVGFYNPTLGVFALHNTLTGSGVDTNLAFGPTGGTAVMGKWTAHFAPGLSVIQQLPAANLGEIDQLD